MRPVLYWVTEEQNALLPRQGNAIFIDGRWVWAGYVGVTHPPITVHAGGGMTSNGRPFVLPDEAYAGLDELYEQALAATKGKRKQ